MWEKINKVKAQVIACMVIIAASYGLAYYAVVFGIPESAMRVVDKITDLSLMGAIAWLFTSSKQDTVR